MSADQGDIMEQMLYSYTWAFTASHPVRQLYFHNQCHENF